MDAALPLFGVLVGLPLPVAAVVVAVTVLMGLGENRESWHPGQVLSLDGRLGGAPGSVLLTGGHLCWNADDGGRWAVPVAGVTVLSTPADRPTGSGELMLEVPGEGVVHLVVCDVSLSRRLRGRLMAGRERRVTLRFATTLVEAGAVDGRTVQPVG